MRKLLFLVLILGITGLYAQTPDVVINEFRPKGSEWVELYNTTGSAIDLSNWLVHSVEDGDTLTLSGTINAADYAVFSLNYLLDNDGDSLFLIDSSGDTIDFVFFGNLGPAPLAIDGWSCARITDGYYTGDLASDFNIDGTPTEGFANDAASAPLNAVVAINEIDPYPDSTFYPDSVELYNPGASPVDITGWQMSDGDDWGVIGSHQIPAQGFIVIDEDEIGLDFSSYDVCYLFTPDTQRVDQMGWFGEYNDFTFQRIPDGSPPYNGFDWISSGGGTVLFDTSETWGYSNGGTFVVEDPGFQVNFDDYRLQCVPVNQGRNVRISFTAPVPVQIKVYSITGRLVNDLYQGEASRGVSLQWNGRDVNGDRIAFGSYLVVMETEDQLITEKVNIFIK